MGQVKVQVTLANVRELAMSQLGHLAPEAVHTCQVEALIDTGTLRSVVPPAVADALGLLRLRRSEAQMADGRWGEVDVCEPVQVRMVAGIERRHEESMLVMGETVLLGAMVLEGMDLLVDCARQQLVPNVGTLYQPVFRV
jgi:predicted aspartyl protease